MPGRFGVFDHHTEQVNGPGSWWSAGSLGAATYVLIRDREGAY